MTATVLPFARPARSGDLAASADLSRRCAEYGIPVPSRALVAWFRSCGIPARWAPVAAAASLLQAPRAPRYLRLAGGAR